MCGLLTLVFIHGFGAGFFGFERAAAIDAWVPLFLFAVLFGLSMDYQVFLISRIKERYDRGDTTHDAVETGVASTARIISGAALIIIVVFTGFARGQLVQFQEMGFGIAVALLLDATIIRCVVLPSTLVILGRWTWYLPNWLEWLPPHRGRGPGARRSDTTRGIDHMKIHPIRTGTVAVKTDDPVVARVHDADLAIPDLDSRDLLPSHTCAQRPVEGTDPRTLRPAFRSVPESWGCTSDRSSSSADWRALLSARWRISPDRVCANTTPSNAIAASLANANLPSRPTRSLISGKESSSKGVQSKPPEAHTRIRSAVSCGQPRAGRSSARRRSTSLFTASRIASLRP